MGMTPEEVAAYARNLQRQQRQREIAERLQEDFTVFVSYSHADDVAARRITDLFDRLGIKHVIDKKEVEWGDDIRDFALQQISQCTHYLLVLSEASAKSKWCALEFGVALGGKKEALLFLTNADLQVPAYAANFLATPDLRAVERYFSRNLIRPEAVEKFLAEIIADADARLGKFKRVETDETGCMRWEAPDRGAVESREPDPMYFYIDDYHLASPDWRLVILELRGPFDEAALVLHYSSPAYRPKTYELTFRPELKGIALKSTVARPEKHGSDIIGVRLTDSKGAVCFVDRTPSVTEQLALQSVYGWHASRSFWERTFERLRSQLPEA